MPRKPKKFRNQLTLLIVLALSLPVNGDWKDEIGFTRLQALAGGELSLFPGNGVTQVEAFESGNYKPDPANPAFSNKSFVLKSGASGNSNHATHVAYNFFGSTSQLPGSGDVDLYSADHWISSGFLNAGTGIPPLVENRAVQNHSWAGSVGSADEEVSARIDYAIDRDGFVCAVGSDNAASTNLPELLCQSYHTISVGRDDGGHSAGTTTVGTNGRMKPDMVAPSAAPEYASSWTTPMVAGSAGLLFAELTAAPHSLTGADRPRVIKAILMASATKNTVPNWDHTATSPLDSIYGAGELNIWHAFHTAFSGKHAASSSVSVPQLGWDANAVGNSEKTYYFTIPAGSPPTPFCAALTWHRAVSTGFWTGSPANLTLRLHHAASHVTGTQMAISNSSVDNVELVFESLLSPGDYALVVSRGGGGPGTQYALAWHSLPAVTISATVSTAKEIDGQTGQITVTRSGSTALPLYVPLTIGGTAVAGSHYTPLPASITIPAGFSSSTLQVTPVSDFLAQGNRTVTVAVAADFALVRDPAQFAQVNIEDKPFDAWRFAQFSTPALANPAISGETADPDGDRLTNLIEYALNLDPELPEASPVNLIDISGYLAISAAQGNTGEITWGAETSADLIGWLPATPVNDTPGIFKARDTVLKSAADRRFIRLKITRP